MLSVEKSEWQEKLRLNRLHKLGILDTETELVFDTLIVLAAKTAATPIAVITLIDSHRQWFKSKVGLPGVSETPRVVSFCTHTIEGSGLMEVRDALLDSRFVDNPLVTGYPKIRFYAGIPLTTSDGFRVGALCVIDHVPRRLTTEQTQMLRQLADAAAQALEYREEIIGKVGKIRYRREAQYTLCTLDSPGYSN